MYMNIPFPPNIAVLKSAGSEDAKGAILVEGSVSNL